MDTTTRLNPIFKTLLYNQIYVPTKQNVINFLFFLASKIYLPSERYNSKKINKKINR